MKKNASIYTANVYCLYTHDDVIKKKKKIRGEKSS